MDDIASEKAKKPWKQIIFWISFTLLMVTCYFVYSIYVLGKWSFIKDIWVEYMCKRTWWMMKKPSCGNYCWQGYVLTKNKRVNEELNLNKHRSCPFDACGNRPICSCPEWRYFGSIMEWCINNSERETPQ